MYVRCNRRDLADDRWRAKVWPEFDRDHGSILVAGELRPNLHDVQRFQRNFTIFIAIRPLLISTFRLLILNFPNSFPTIKIKISDLI